MRTTLFHLSLLILVVSGEYHPKPALLPDRWEQDEPRQELFLSSAGVLNPPPDYSKGRLWLVTDETSTLQQDQPYSSNLQLLIGVDLSNTNNNFTNSNSTSAECEADWDTTEELEGDNTYHQDKTWQTANTTLDPSDAYCNEQLLSFPEHFLSTFSWALFDLVETKGFLEFWLLSYFIGIGYYFLGPDSPILVGGIPFAPSSSMEDPKHHGLAEAKVDPWDEEALAFHNNYDDGPPKIPSRILFGSESTPMDQHISMEPNTFDYYSNSDNDSLGHSYYSHDDLPSCPSAESSWAGDIIPFHAVPTLFPYHISSGISNHGRCHSNSTMSSILSETRRDLQLQDLELAWAG